MVLCSIFTKIRNWFKGCHVVVQEKIEKYILKINGKKEELCELSDAVLQLKTMELKKRIEDANIKLCNKNNNFINFLNCEKTNEIIVEAMAIFGVVLYRIIDIAPYDVQYFAAYIMLGDNIAEMKTGEGKTIAIAIAAYIKFLFGNRVHIVTANNYLVRRDAAEMGKIYSFLGLSVNFLAENMTPSKLREIYNSDVLYATGTSLVFSYLRNTLVVNIDDLFLNMNGKETLAKVEVIIDEVDALLIDEARTPLTISGKSEDISKYLTLARELIANLANEDIEIKIKEANVLLLDSGIVKIERSLKEKNFIKDEESIMDSNHIVLLHYLHNALRAEHIYQEGKEYMVQGNQLLIIDSITGRVMAGRSYGAGLHQAIQIKHGIKPDAMSKILSSMTYDYYFAKYKSRAGTTGTAVLEQDEFRKVYDLGVLVVPLNRPNCRKDHDDLIFCTMEERDKALIRRVKDYYKEKRPVLLYTLSEKDSDKFSNLLKRNRVSHQVLNAKNHENEAYIIAQAGRLGKVTVVTNMAGRGTDILLGGNAYMMAKQSGAINDAEKLDHLVKECAVEKEQVKELGGLAIVAVGRNDNRRLDDQMCGRAGRQGEPGSSVYYISLEDALFAHMGQDNIARMQSIMQTWGGMKKGQAIEDSYVNSAILTSQKAKEATNKKIREDSRKFMHISLVQLDKIFDMRLQILFEKNMYNVFKFSIKEEVTFIVEKYVNESTNELDDIEEMVRYISKRFKVAVDVNDVKDKTITFVIDFFVKKLIDITDKLESEIRERFSDVIRDVYIRILDELWVNHVNELEVLKQVIILRAYGQKDIEVEYDREAYNLFVNMLNNIRSVFVVSILQFNESDESDESGN